MFPVLSPLSLILSLYLSCHSSAVIMAPFRLAALLCGVPIPPLFVKDDDFHKMFDTWLRSVSPSIDFTLDAFNVVDKMEYPSEDAEYDGVILTGSGQSNYFPAASTFRSDALSTAASAYEDIEWINKLVEYTANLARSKPNVKLFGTSDRKPIERSKFR